MLSRRHFFFGSLGLPAFAAKKHASERPNILLIVVDYLPAWVLGIYGNKIFRTPNIDRLAQTGTRFDRHVVASPAAALSRATLLTGRTPMQLGAAGTVSTADVTLQQVLSGLDYGCFATAAGASAAVTAEAQKLLDRQSPGRPFLLTVAYTGLHPPYDGVPPKYAALYAQAKFDTIGYEPPAPARK